MENNAIRVAFVLEDARMAGPQAYLLQLIHELNEVESIVIIPELNSEEFNKRLRNYSINTVNIKLTRPSSTFRGFFKYMCNFPVEVLRLRRTINLINADIVYVGGGAWQVKGIMAAKLLKIKSIWQLNDTCLPKVIRGAFFILCTLADSFVFVSEKTFNYYKPIMRLAKNRYKIIPSPINCRVFNVLERPSYRQTMIKGYKNSFVIGTVCSINPVKNIKYLIEIAHKLENSKFKDLIEFKIFGPIPDTQKKYFLEIQKLIVDLKLNNIKFMGATDQVVKALKSIDVYLCTSDFEASPIAVWEAMASGVPVVSTDVGDVPKHILSSGAGSIIPKNNPKVAADVILKLLNDCTKLENYGIVAAQYAAAAFDAKKCAALHTEFFNQINQVK